MSMTTFAAKWGVGPTFAAVMLGGTALGATVAVFEFTTLGQTLGIVSKAAPVIGPSMKDGADAVTAKIGAQGGGTQTTPPAAAPGAKGAAASGG